MESRGAPINPLRHENHPSLMKRSKTGAHLFLGTCGGPLGRLGNVCRLCVKSIISHSAKLPEQQPISFGRSVIELNAWKCLHFVR